MDIYKKNLRKEKKIQERKIANLLKVITLIFFIRKMEIKIKNKI